MKGIAIWGLGQHALRSVLPAIQDSPLLRLVGICSRNDAARDETAKRCSAQSWSNPTHMLACPDVDIVYLATPTGLHHAQGLQVLQAQKHLICEKSLTAVPSRGEDLVLEATERSLILCEAFAFLFHPRMQVIREAIQSDAFGKPIHAFSCFALPPLDQPGFRNTRALGGGALLDVGCYPLALMNALFGGTATVLHSGITTSASSEVDTGGDASLRFADGMRADISWGYNRAYSADAMILGEKQTIVASRVFTKETHPESSILLRDRFGNATPLDIPLANGFVGMFAEVVAACDDAAIRQKLVQGAATQARLMTGVLECAQR